MSWDDRMPDVGEYVIATAFHGNDNGYQLSGEPILVKAVTIPFMLIETPIGNVHSIDMRMFSFVRATRDYVRQYHRLIHDDLPVPNGARRRRRRKKPEELGQEFCPNCRRKMIQVRIAPGQWVYRCEKCGLQGGQVPSGPRVPILGGGFGK